MIQNGYGKIHLLEGPDIKGRPILHVPGMFGVAEDCIPEMMGLSHRKSYAMSLRGRGLSEVQKSYDIQDHVSDVIAALEEINQPTTLCGHSVGNLFCIGAAYVRPDLVRAICLIDKGLTIQVSKKWLDFCLSSKPKTVSVNTVKSIYRDLNCNLWPILSAIDSPIYFFRGRKKGNHTTDKDVSQFRAAAMDFHLIELFSSGHWPSDGVDYNLFMNVLDRVSR